MLTRKQISQWIEYYLYQFGKALEREDHSYRKICGRQLRILRALEKEVMKCQLRAAIAEAEGLK